MKKKQYEFKGRTKKTKKLYRRKEWSKEEKGGLHCYAKSYDSYSGWFLRTFLWMSSNSFSFLLCISNNIRESHTSVELFLFSISSFGWGGGRVFLPHIYPSFFFFFGNNSWEMFFSFFPAKGIWHKLFKVTRLPFWTYSHLIRGWCEFSFRWCFMWAQIKGNLFNRLSMLDWFNKLKKLWVDFSCHLSVSQLHLVKNLRLYIPSLTTKCKYFPSNP